MKNLLLIIAMMLPVFAFANNDVTNRTCIKTSLTEEVKSSYNIFRRVTLQKTDIALPLVIQVNAPNETVIGISGPATPNVPNWNVRDGILTITYTEENQIAEIRAGGIFYIEVPTTPMMYYAIELTVE